MLVAPARWLTIQATTPIAVNVKSEIVTVPAASPSRPSVRFTPFAAPAIMTNRSTYQPHDSCRSTSSSGRKTFVWKSRW